MITHDDIFDTVIRFVTYAVLYILLIAIIVGLLSIVINVGIIVYEILGGNFTHVSFIDVVVSVLTIFVLIDLFKTFIDYRENKRIRLTYIADATILIVLREVAAGVYTHHIEYEFIISISILLLALGLIRFIATKYSPE